MYCNLDMFTYMLRFSKCSRGIQLLPYSNIYSFCPPHHHQGKAIRENVVACIGPGLGGSTYLGRRISPPVARGLSLWLAEEATRFCRARTCPPFVLNSAR